MIIPPVPCVCLLALPALAAGECPSDVPFSFVLDAPGTVEEEDGLALDIYLLPGEPHSLEVTAYLETNPPGEEATVDLCGLFCLGVAHDPSVLEITDVDTEEDAGTGGFVGGRPLETEGVSGFIAGSAICSRPQPFSFLGRMSLVRVKYRLVAPNGIDAAGRDFALRMEYHAFSPTPGDCNSVLIGGTRIAPCLRTLQVRYHIREDAAFIRGDANFDARLDVSDPVTVLHALFHGDARVRCGDAADANDDGHVDISDAVGLFGYLFLGSAPLPAPFPAAGEDPTPDAIRCLEPSSV